MKTHFDPYADSEPDEVIEKYPCGTLIPLSEPSVTSSWGTVTCCRCIKNKVALQLSFEESEKEIVRQMGAMADWYNNEERENSQHPTNVMRFAGEPALPNGNK